MIKKFISRETTIHISACYSTMLLGKVVPISSLIPLLICINKKRFNPLVGLCATKTLNLDQFFLQCVGEILQWSKLSRILVLEVALTSTIVIFPQCTVCSH